MRVRELSLWISLVALLLGCIQPAIASNQGDLIVRVHPKDTYVYADGQPLYWSKGHYFALAPGEHKINLYNYGFRPEQRTVTITSHKTTVIDVNMQEIPGLATGPWGCITIKGPHGAAVLLNGKEPADYFVGNIKEFDHDFIWHKELLLPPGQQQVTISYYNREPWTVTVDVQPNKRVVVDAFKGVTKTVAWSRGEQMNEVPKFKGGLITDHVAVEKVSGNFSASESQVNCGQAAQLNWMSKGATKVVINGAPVTPDGDQTVSPKQNTTYNFVASGPGGTYTSDATVSVNNSIPVALNVTPADINVQNNGTTPSTATVTWSAPGAESVTIDPIGTVGPSGSQQVPVTVNNTNGPVDQTVTYTLHATNACGGSETRTAELHIMGNTAAAVTPPAESETAQNQAPAELPHTASQLPLMALMGILFLAAAALFRLIAKSSV